MFFIMFYVLDLTTVDLKFLKLTYNAAVYRLFPTLPCKRFKLERPSTEKLKFYHLDKVYGMFWFFGILKAQGYVCVK